MTQGTKPELIVLQSFPTPRPTTNPYIVMLHDALATTDGLSVLTFTWRRALFGRYHVFHAHWPEILVSGQSSVKKFLRQILTVVFLLRLQLGRIPVIRTQHNLYRPQGISRREQLLLSWFESITRYSILLNADTPVPEGTGSMVIPHGHYRDWFGPYPRAEKVPGRIAYFGLVRQYKNVGHLIDTFRRVSDPDLSLHIAGNPSSEELSTDLMDRARHDSRITVDFRFVPDADLVTAVSEAELIVLPYREMHNSGGALAALSLDRPVLVPNNEVNQALGEELGHEWVLRYEDSLTPEDIQNALDSVRKTEATSPDLSAREWADCGLHHAAAYRAAILQRRRVWNG